MRRIFAIALIATLAACAGTTTEYSRGDAQSVQEEARRQEALTKAASEANQISVKYTPVKITDSRYTPEDRIAMIAGRITTAAAPYCGNRVENSFLLGVRAYANEPVVITSPLAVKAPGEKNDIMYGDQIQAIDATVIGNGTPGLRTLVDVLTKAEQQNKAVTFQVQRAGISDLVKVRLKPAPRCNFGMKVERTDEVNAYADGRDLHFTTKLMDMLTDDELAFVAGHELAHNIFEHVGKTQNNAALGGLGGTLVDLIANSQGVDTGGKFGNLGANIGVLKYSQDFEREADYVGMYITTLAGFPPEAAIGVIEKFSRQNPNSIRYASTHPANAERAVNARLTLDEIRKKQAAGQPLQPNMRPPQ